MTESNGEVVSGKVVDEESDVTLAELCEACAVHAEAVEAMVLEGIVAPIGGEESRWRFSRSSVVRVRTVVRIQRDLHVNLAGAALALELLERIEQLRARLKSVDPEYRG